MKEGTFSSCSNCKCVINCCQMFDKINAPTLNAEEIGIIRKNFLNFYDVHDTNLFTLKIKNTDCIFFKNGKCCIYDIRPLDCRLYPFDIIKQNDKYYLILYKLSCFQEKDLLKNLDEIDLLVEKVKPWIQTFTNEICFTKMQKMKYSIIKEIEI